MPIISCPRSDCQYATEDVEAVVAAALLNIHATTHSASGGNSNGTNTSARPPPIERPKARGQNSKYFQPNGDHLKSQLELQEIKQCISSWVV